MMMMMTVVVVLLLLLLLLLLFFLRQVAGSPSPQCQSQSCRTITPPLSLSLSNSHSNDSLGVCKYLLLLESFAKVQGCLFLGVKKKKSLTALTHHVIQEIEFVCRLQGSDCSKNYHSSSGHLAPKLLSKEIENCS